MALRTRKQYNIITGKGPNIWVLVQGLFGDNNGSHVADFTIMAQDGPKLVKVRIDDIRRRSPETFIVRGMVLEAGGLSGQWYGGGFEANNYNPNERTGTLLFDSYEEILPPVEN